MVNYTSGAKFMKKVDIVLLVLFPIVAVVLSLAIEANFLTSTLLFFGLPSLWLSFRTRHQVAKTFLFALVLTVPMAFFVDYVAMVSGAWFVPETVFPFRVLNVVPVEDFIWGFLLVYSIVIFYEHFLDKGKQELIDKRMKYLIWPWVSLLLVFFAIYFTSPVLLNIQYAYLWIGMLFVLLPAVTSLVFFPRLLSKYVKTASYFFVLAVSFELTSLHLNQWSFPEDGYFIGWVEILGFRFPFEEFFFWIVLAAIAVLSYYEFFDDDRR